MIPPMLCYSLFEIEQRLTLVAQGAPVTVDERWGQWRYSSSLRFRLIYFSLRCQQSESYTRLKGDVQSSL